MSISTRPVSGSPIFNVLQQFLSQLAPVVHQRASNGAVSVSGAANGIAERPMGFFRRLGQRIERREMERQEAYLAGSTDIYDLEHRMKQLEYMRSSNPSQWGSNA